MANDGSIGFSFEPSARSIGVGSGNNQAIGGPQSAVQVKSFTLPNRFVPGQIAPQQLLQSPGGGGQLDVNILRQLMQMFAPQGQQPSTPALGNGYQDWMNREHGINQAPKPFDFTPLPHAMAQPQQPQAPPPYAPPRFIPGQEGNLGTSTAPPTEEPAREVQSAGDRKRAGLGLFD